jgi:hypothetical protein
MSQENAAIVLEGIGQFRRLTADWGQQGVSDVKVVADQSGWVVVLA